MKGLLLASMVAWMIYPWVIGIECTMRQGSSILHPSILSRILHPSSGLDTRTAFHVITAVKDDGPASLSVPLRLFYFASLRLGLNYSDPSSGKAAFRNCMYIKPQELTILHAILSETSPPSASILPGPSLCALAMLDLVEEGRWADDGFPSGYYHPIPLGLRISLAYHSSESGDPNYRAIIGPSHMSRWIEQAFYFEDVRSLTRQALVHGEMDWNLQPSPPSPGAEKLTFNVAKMQDIVLSNPRLSALAITENIGWIWADRSRGSHIRLQLMGLMRHMINYTNEMNQRHLELLNAYRALVMDDQLRMSLTDKGTRRRFIEKLEALLESGLDINIFGRDLRNLAGRNPIFYLARQGKVELISILLDYGLCLNFKTGPDYLNFAVRGHQLKMTRFLLEHGANAKKLYGWEDGITYYIEFSVEGQQQSSLQLLQLLVNYGADPWLHGPLKRNLLHIAASCNNLPVVDYLIHETKGALNTKFTRSLLGYACYSQHPRNILLYLMSGYAGSIGMDDDQLADGCYVSLLNRMFTELAVEFSRMQAYAQAYSLPIPRSTYFYRACELSGSIELLSVLLKRGANINEKDEITYQTCLILAIKRHDLVMASFLVNHGADLGENSHVPARTKFWQFWKWGSNTPPHLVPFVLAARVGVEFVELLVEAGKKRGINLLANCQLVDAAWYAASKAGGRADVTSYLFKSLILPESPACSSPPSSRSKSPDNFGDAFAQRDFEFV